jgi:hypothetical protein
VSYAIILLFLLPQRDYWLWQRYSRHPANSKFSGDYAWDPKLVRHEVWLATCTPQVNLDDFYLLQLPSGDTTRLPTTVLIAYLKRHGVDLALFSFFAGKRFYMHGPRHELQAGK